MVKIKNLEKKFGDLEVINGINLSIEAGRATAILGPNASGKTTLMKCVLGLVKPDNGEIHVNGKYLNGDWDYKENIGYMPQTARFPDNLTPREIMNFLMDLRGKPKEFDDELIKKFCLESELDKAVRVLSGGTRQKVSAVLSFLFRPDILILDEPTAGLDPVSSRHLKQKIIKEKQAGKTIILTSHIMNEVEELADDVIFILEGKIHFEGSMNHILNESPDTNLEIAIAQILTRERI